MVPGEDQPVLLGLILFLAAKDIEDGILPGRQLCVEAAEVVVHERLDGLVDVINDAFQLVVLVGVDLWATIRWSLATRHFRPNQRFAHLMTEDDALLYQRLRQQHRVLLVHERVGRAVYQQIVLRQEAVGVQR